jgi:two-component system chemotaxis sensor kinase CheA
VAALDALLGAGVGESTQGTGASLDFAPLMLEPLDVGNAAFSRWEIGFSPKAGFYEHGHDPVLFLLALSDLGWHGSPVRRRSPAGPQGARPRRKLPVLARDPRDGPERRRNRGGVRLRRGALRADHPTPPEEAAPEADLDLATGPSLALPEVELPTQPAALSKPKAEATEAARPTLRVDLNRVDKLVNSVGELIINQAAIAEKLSSSAAPMPKDLMSDLDHNKLLARQIQEAVMAIRAQPVRSLFQRMARVVREAARATGKPVQLITEGEGTEVDRTVVEHLADPLTHMVRNAIDHGARSAGRPPRVRKPERGHRLALGRASVGQRGHPRARRRRRT